MIVMNRLPFIFFLFSFAFCDAQQVMVKGGLTATKVTDNAFDPENAQPRLNSGFFVGLSIEPSSGKSVVFYPELYFAQKGYKVDETSASVTVFVQEEMDIRINYIEIPLHAKIYTNPKKRNVFLLAGMHGSFAVGGNYAYNYLKKVGANTQAVSTSGGIDFGDQLIGQEGENFSVTNTFDFGVQLGFGFKVFRRSVIEFRYDFGFITLASSDNSEPKNRALLLSFGVPITK